MTFKRSLTNAAFSVSRFWVSHKAPRYRSCMPFGIPNVYRGSFCVAASPKDGAGAAIPPMWPGQRRRSRSSARDGGKTIQPPARC